MNKNISIFTYFFTIFDLDIPRRRLVKMSEFSPGVSLSPQERAALKDLKRKDALLEERITRAERKCSETTCRPSKMLFVKDLFASDDFNCLNQGSLHNNKRTTAYCHDLFDLNELLEGKKLTDVSKCRLVTLF